MKLKTLNIVLVILLISTAKNYSQTCGFGCLGLGSIFGGYTIQNYDAGNINLILVRREYLASRSHKEKVDFGMGKGFRVGANFFKINHKGIFLTAKGFYQFLKEKQSLIISSINIERQYELKTNYFGVGIDFGVPINSFIDLKIIDGGINFYKIKLEEKKSGADEIKFESDKYKVGYSVGSGLIFYIVQNYISLEATAQYHIFEETELKEKQSTAYLRSEQGIIKFENISYTLQLNIGLPL